MHVRDLNTLTPRAQARLNAFKADLPNMSVEELLIRHILEAESSVLTEDGQLALVQRFQGRFGLEAQSITVVGSSVTGFSISPRQRYKLIDLNDTDIDVAIIDAQLFADIWADVKEYMDRTRYWHKSDEFDRYIVQGWIRPDILPPSVSRPWWEFFKEMKAGGEFGAIDVRAALYPSEVFLRAYQLHSIELCKNI